jgi:hypothetical protein
MYWRNKGCVQRTFDLHPYTSGSARHLLLLQHCDFRLQEPKALFLSRMCFSIPLMTTDNPEWGFFSPTFDFLSFSSQIFVWFYVNIQRQRLPFVFFHVVIQPCVTYAADKAPLHGLLWGAVLTFCADVTKNESVRHNRSLAWIVTALDHTFFVFVSALKMDLKAAKQIMICVYWSTITRTSMNPNLTRFCVIN